MYMTKAKKTTIWHEMHHDIQQLLMVNKAYCISHTVFFNIVCNAWTEKLPYTVLLQYAKATVYSMPTVRCLKVYTTANTACILSKNTTETTNSILQKHIHDSNKSTIIIWTK